MSIYPVVFIGIDSIICPIGLTNTENPLFVDLMSGNPVSMLLYLTCVSCCLGPSPLPNQASLDILIIN